MKSSTIRELTLYRYRYIIGYGLFITVLMSLLLIDITRIPHGVSESEMRSAVASNSLNPLSARVGDIINLPYHIVQKISISVLGLSTFSVRLPSVLLALVAGGVLATMLHVWFRRNVALIALLISTASVPFITAARSGTPGIMYILLLLIILLGAIKLTLQHRGTFAWKVIVFVSSLLLVYIPFGVYTLIALSIAGLLHPHIRHQINKTERWQSAVLAACAIILLLPMFIAGYYDNGVIQQLFGIQSIEDHITPSALAATSVSLAKTMFVFSKANVSETITPFLNITFLLLVVFGLIKVIADRHAARSYLLLIWLGFSIPMIYIDPSQLALIFVPCILLMAIGIETFVSQWYQLFPRNPYARIGALIPLSLLVIGLLTIAVSRYFYAYTYTDTRPIFHPEISAIRSVVDQKPAQLVVPASHLAFYDILRRDYPELSVVDISQAKTNNRRIVVASVDPGIYGTPSRIVTTYTRANGVLVRVYDAR